MEREACVYDHGFERSDLCAEIIVITIIIILVILRYIHNIQSPNVSHVSKIGDLWRRSRSGDRPNNI